MARLGERSQDHEQQTVLVHTVKAFTNDILYSQYLCFAFSHVFICLRYPAY